MSTSAYIPAGVKHFGAAKQAEVCPPTSIVKQPRHGLELREAVFEDYEQIGRLEDKYGLESKGREEWEHLWINNPTYKTVGRRWPIGWVLENEDRRIVGYLGNIPLSYEFQGRKLVAAVTHAWVVDLPYRSYSILLLDSYFRQKSGADLFLSTTLNAQATDAFHVFKSPAVPVGRWDESVFWITHYRGFVSSWIRLKAPRMNLFTGPFSAGLWLQDTLKRRSSKSNPDVKVEAVASFDQRFDIFWEALRARYPNVLLALRSSEELEWHFRYAMQKKNVWIFTIAHGSELAAYAVFCRQDSVRFGLKRMRLVDFQALDGNSALLLPTLSRALQQCRTEQIHMLECIGPCPLNGGVLASLASRQRKLPSWLYFYRARDKSLEKNLETREAWRPSWFDGDGTL